jgi:hypothetical protein
MRVPQPASGPRVGEDEDAQGSKGPFSRLMSS